MTVHADRDAVAKMSAKNPDEPVVMLNLLRYRDVAEPGHGVDGLPGEDAYREYGRRFAALNQGFGSEPIWMGRADSMVIGPEGECWDVAILVRYPTRRQFVAMINDPDYAKIAPIRAAALADSRLIETRQLLPRS